MPGNFHIHGAFMHQQRIAAVDVDGPDTVNFMPGAFVAKHQQVGINRRKLDMVEPGIF